MGDINTINSSLVYTFNLNYYFTENIGIGIEFENISTSTNGNLQVYNSSYSSENHANGVLLLLNARTNPLNDNLYLIGKLGIGQYSSSYTEDEEGFVTEGTDNAIGFKISGGIEYMVSPNFGLQVQSGYRSLSLDNYDVTFFLPDNSSVSLDYSGIFGEIKAVIYF